MDCFDCFDKLSSHLAIGSPYKILNRRLRTASQRVQPFDRDYDNNSYVLDIINPER